MPRPLWTGAISFGLVTIAIKIISATEDRSLHFHQVHLEDVGRVRTRKVCEIEEEVVRKPAAKKSVPAKKTSAKKTAAAKKSMARKAPAKKRSAS